MDFRSKALSPSQVEELEHLERHGWIQKSEEISYTVLWLLHINNQVKNWLDFTVRNFELCGKNSKIKKNHYLFVELSKLLHY